ncbi:hypothetical protein ARZXY2_4880 (plasmid) [Arthrobacter sp. ZXY-2]|nr:hypothetical protein ARZXY2_4880 [Arthrobacter sp. ZXY-2]
MYQLADTGTVTADPPKSLRVEDRLGKRVRYAIVREEIVKHYEALGRALKLLE